MILLWSVAFIVALALLIYSSERFTTAAEKLGLHYGMSPFIVGVTIVSIGTSLPELAAGVIAANNGTTEIVVGNVIGSNISNLFLILGLGAVVATWKKKLKFEFNFSSVDMPLFLGSVFLLAFAIWDGYFSLGEAIIFFLAYLMYMLYSINTGKKAVKKEEAMIEKNIPHQYQKKGFPAKSFVTVVVCAFLIYIGAQLTVDSIIQLSFLLNVNSEIIALSAVALGTSLPELSVTIAAARKGSLELALGNVIGSNIFNTFMVMAIPAFVKDLVISQSILQFHLPLLIGGSVLVFLMMLDKEMTKWKGNFLILFYLFFLVELFL